RLHVVEEPMDESVDEIAQRTRPHALGVDQPREEPCHSTSTSPRRTVGTTTSRTKAGSWAPPISRVAVAAPIAACRARPTAKQVYRLQQFVIEHASSVCRDKSVARPPGLGLRDHRGGSAWPPNPSDWHFGSCGRITCSGPGN